MLGGQGALWHNAIMIPINLNIKAIMAVQVIPQKNKQETWAP